MPQMLTTYEKLFCQMLDTSIPALAGIDTTWREQGVAAAERQLADYIRRALPLKNYFTIPYHERENMWCDPQATDFEVAELILSGELCSCGFSHKFPDVASVD